MILKKAVISTKNLINICHKKLSCTFGSLYDVYIPPSNDLITKLIFSTMTYTFSIEIDSTGKLSIEDEKSGQKLWKLLVIMFMITLSFLICKLDNSVIFSYIKWLYFKSDRTIYCGEPSVPTNCRRGWSVRTTPVIFRRSGRNHTNQRTRHESALQVSKIT